MTVRLPVPGSDRGDWGKILNSFLEVSHSSDGALFNSAIARAGGVTSINTITPTNGGVSLATTNLSDTGISNPSSNQVLTYDGSKWVNATPPAGGVASVFGRSGTVTAQTGDYTAAEVTHAADKSSSTAQAFTGAVRGVIEDMGGELYNVLAYGATGKGTADDTAAIQAALAAAPSGGVVYMPPGIYKTSAPLTVPPGVTFRGTTRTFWFPSEGGTQDGVLAPNAKIMPSASFSGAAVIQIVDQATGGYSAGSGNQTLAYITVDGSNLPNGNSVDGFRTFGSTFGLTVTYCGVTNVGGHGFETVANSGTGEGYGYLDELEMSHCVFNAITGDGVHLLGTADSTFTSCHAINCDNGWYLDNVANSRFVGCKAEWSSIGWYVEWPINTNNIARQTFVGCSTDNNTSDGFYITGGQTGGIVLLDGCDFHEDGRNASGTAAGIHVSGAAFPVIITGCGVFIGPTASSGNGPAYGLAIDTDSTLVSIENCYLQGATSGYHTDSTGTVILGSNVSVSNGGTATAPTIATLLTPTSQSAAQSPTTVTPSDTGLLGWAFDPIAAAYASNQPTAGQINAVKIKVAACTISYLWLGINAPGASLTAGENFAGLYSSDGSTLLSATADQTTAWTNDNYTAVKMALITPQVVSAGWVYVAWFANGGTIPKFQFSGAANIINTNLTNATARFATGGTGATTAMPASLTLVESGNAYWAAVS